MNARWNFENTIYLKDVKLPDFANYKFVINRSYGHALGPCAILYSLGFDENSKEFNGLEKFFRSYIVAKQLNDDAHDWQEDFTNGHITPVIVMLIKKLLRKNPNYKFQSNKDLLNSLQEIFWYETILDVCDEILVYVSKATKALSEIQIIEDKSYLENLLIGVETGARRGLKEQKQTVEFINVYS